MIQEGIRLAVDGENLSSDVANRVMEDMMSGKATPSQMASFLTAMRVKGETKDELLGFVRCMRSRMVSVRAPDGAVDLCGTGGDGLNTFNISTAASFVVAAAGATVAKHGNKAVSSRSGSADLLSALGIPVDLGHEEVERCLRETKIGFMFAPEFHQSMKNVMPTRRELGIRTFFNILGPMANPASVRRQLIGVYDPAVAPVMADVLREIGTERAMVVNGCGMDEMTNLGPTTVVELRDGKTDRYDVIPGEFGLDLAEPNELAGGSAMDNARILLRILEGEESPKSDIVTLNSAAALYISGKASDLHEGFDIAREAIRNGSARSKLVEFHDSCTRLESEAQLRSDISRLRGRRVLPDVLKARCADISEDLLAQISTIEGGPEHIRKLDPDIVTNPTVLTVLTLNRLRRVLTDANGHLPVPRRAKRSLSQAIAAAPGLAVIGEYKPRSPSTSKLEVPPAPVEIAQAYSNSAIAGVSVLMEEDYFSGGGALFRELRSMMDLPMLFKDFVASEKQIELAEDVGADAVLLVAKSLTRSCLDELVRATVRKGMEPLVEVHDEIDLKKVASCTTYSQIEMIGVNGRDLRTLEVDFERAIELRKSVPGNKLVIAESGVKTEQDLLSLGGFDGVLIGSLFMKSPDIGRTVEDTVTTARRVAR
ncbi:MAG: anthranilate phosphoribosyltransferase [Thermoplasmata archaeon]|nr:anthranilate phosphoribosyltransferase [Thermoplasmata archaeon]